MCTFNTNKIYLTWRKGVGNIRHIIGVLEKSDDNYLFYYITDNIDKATKDGFSNYPAFNNLENIYTENVLEVFNRRLLNPTRRDYDDFLKYWCAEEYKDNIFAILGLTGAKLLTDNFEFIAPHYELPAKFNTDISWLNIASEDTIETIKNLKNNSDIQEKLTLNLEPNNSFDKKAVKVLYNNEPLGYIKSIHCENISDALANNHKISYCVKNITKNGTIKEILLRINIL